MEIEERLNYLDKAAELINEAISMIGYAVEDTELEVSANAYIMGHLGNWANGSNPYDGHIPNLKRELEKTAENV